MTDDEPTYEDTEPTYFELVVTHMLHRLWELQVAQLIIQAGDDEGTLKYIEEIVEAQTKGDYKQPFTW